MAIMKILSMSKMIWKKELPQVLSQSTQKNLELKSQIMVLIGWG